MIAIIVATPLQLFNSLMIMRHHFPEERCDIFALNITVDMHPILENHKKLDIIDSVFYLKDIWRHRNSFRILLAHIFLTKEQRSFLKEVSNRTYSDLLSTWVGINSTWLLNHLKKFSPKIRVHFYEEGIGVYVSYIYGYYHNIKKMYKLLGYIFEEDVLEDLYMYKPEICTDINYKIKRIPIGNVVDDDYKFIQKLYHQMSIQPYDCKVIYFDSNFENTKHRGFEEKEIVTLLKEQVGVNNLIVRTHPRSSPNTYIENGIKTDPNINMIWEYILASRCIPENVIFAAPFSSALFTPKFITGKEPRVLILAKAIINEHASDEWASSFWNCDLDKLVLELITLYKDKSRVKLPNNYNEVIAQLNEWK